MNLAAKLTLIAVALMLIVGCFANTASACPTCKDALAGDPANSSMVQGYFWSIIFMMSMPFLVFSTVAAYFYYEVCRARKQQAAATVAPINASPNSSAGPEIALLS